MERLKISVVTPSYNQGNFIEETIWSVVNQGYENLEYIVMDGGSTDSSVEIVKKYEPQLKYWVSEKDKGQTDAINKGFKMATGDIISWLNSDDVYCEGALEAISAYFESHPECQWLAGNILFMTGSGQIYIRKYPNSSRLLEKLSMFSVYQPNVFLRRSLLDTIGYPKEEFHMSMDYEWFSRIARKYPIHLINKDIVKFRWHTDSKSSSAPNSANQKRYHQELVKLIRQSYPKFGWFFDRFPEFTFFMWHPIAKFMRLLNRISKGELYKLNDRIVG